MKYIVKTYNDWTRPFDRSNPGSPVIREKETNEWETSDKSLAVQMVRDWLDAPDEELTEDGVRERICTGRDGVSAENLSQILKYYNGRRDIFVKFVFDFNNMVGTGILKYCIPYKLNHFETCENRTNSEEKQNAAYIEIKAED